MTLYPPALDGNFASLCAHERRTEAATSRYQARLDRLLRGDGRDDLVADFVDDRADTLAELIALRRYTDIEDALERFASGRAEADTHTVLAA